MTDKVKSKTAAVAPLPPEARYYSASSQPQAQTEESRSWLKSLEHVLQHALRNEDPEKASMFLDSLIDR